MNDTARKKDTGEPGNGGQFTAPPKPRSGLRLDHSLQTPWAPEPGSDEFDQAVTDLRRRRNRARASHRAEIRNLAAAIGTPSNDGRLVIDTARGMLEEGSLRGRRSETVRFLLERTTELRFDILNHERQLALAEQAQARHHLNQQT